MPKDMFKRKRRNDVTIHRPFKKPRYKQNVRTGGFMGIELKFLDTADVTATLNNPADSTGGELPPSIGSTGCLSAMAQGDGESQRDGRKCVLKSIYIKGIVYATTQLNQTATDNAATVFIALVHDTQTNGATIASENVYTNPGANADLAAIPFRNLQFMKRFRVLKTFMTTLQNPNIAYDGTNLEQQGLSEHFEMYKKLNIPVIHNGTTANVSTVTDNSLHLIGFANNAALAPSIRYNCRVRFVG